MSIWTTDSDWFLVLESIIYSLQELYQSLLVTLFLSLTLLASLGIQQITRDVTNISSIPSLSDARVWKWKQSYCLVFDLVKECDQFFGPFLLLFIGLRYVMFGMMFFQYLMNWLKGEFLDDTVIPIMLKDILSIATILYGAHKMDNEASWLSNHKELPQSFQFISALC